MAIAKLQHIARRLQCEPRCALFVFQALTNFRGRLRVWRKGRQRQRSPALILRRWLRVCAYMFERLWRDQGGASLIEYSILVALITMLIVVGVAVAGAWAQSIWTHLLPMLGGGQ